MGREGHDDIFIQVSCANPKVNYWAIATENVGSTVRENYSNFRWYTTFVHLIVMIITLFHGENSNLKTGGFRRASNYSEDLIR